MTRGSRSRRALFLSLCLAPAALILTVYFVLPLAEVAVISFFRYSATKIWDATFTTENYRQFFRPFYLWAALRTVVFAALVTVVCAILGYPYAYFLARAAPRRRGPYLFALLSPLMMSSVVLVLGWVIFLGREGPAAKLMSLFSLPSYRILYSKTAIVIGLTELLLPFMVISLMSSVEKVQVALEEAAEILGANRFAVFKRVIFPLTRPGLVSGGLLVFTMTLGSLVAPALLGGPSDAMLGNVIYENVMSSLNWPFAAAVSFVLLATTFVLMSLYLRAMRTKAWPAA